MERMTRKIGNQYFTAVGLDEDNWKVKNAIIQRLGAYEDTGLKPDEVEQAMSDCGDAMAENQWAIKDILEFGGIDHLRELVQAERDGRLVVLPCKNVEVYTIEEGLFNCDECENKGKEYYHPRIDQICCDVEDARCPRYVKEHTVKGFEIYVCNGSADLSAPGEWGYEGFEQFSGVDGKWYLARKDAEAALRAKKEGSHELETNCRND